MRAPVDRDEFRIPIGYGYDLAMPEFDRMYLRVVNAYSGECIAYFGADDFAEDPEGNMELLFGILSVTGSHGDFSRLPELAKMEKWGIKTSEMGGGEEDDE